MKRLAKRMLRLVPLLIITVLVLWAGLHTTTGRLLVQDRLNRALAANGGVYPQIEGLGGLWPWTLTVEQVTLLDDQGVWLAGTGIRARVARLQFIRRRVRVRHMTMDAVRMLRLPAAVPPDPDGKAPRRGPPEYPWQIRIDRWRSRDAGVHAPVSHWPVYARLIRGSSRIMAGDSVHVQFEIEGGTIQERPWHARGDFSYEIRGKAFLQTELWAGEDHASCWWVRLHEQDPGRLTVEAGLQDVAHYENFLNIPGLSGPADVRCTIEAQDRGQRLTVNARSAGVRWHEIDLEGVWFRMESDLPWGEGTFRTQGRVRRLKGYGWEAEAVRLQSEMPALTGTVQLSCRVLAPFEGPAQLHSQLDARTPKLTFRESSLRVETDAVLLQTLSASDLTWEEGRISTENLDLAVNDARVRGRLSFHPEEESMAALTFERAPLELLPTVAGHTLQGVGHGRLDVSGPWWRPEGVLDLDVEAFEWEPYADLTLVPSEFTLSARLHAQSLHLSARTAGDYALPAEATLTIPFKDLEGSLPVPDLEADWQAHLEFSAPREPWQSLDEQGRYEWRGQFGGTISMHGPPTAPQLNGQLAFEKGGLRDTLSGLSWEPADMGITISNNVFYVTHALLEGSGGGALRAAGQWQWSMDDPFQGAVTLTFQQLAILQESYGEISVTGHLKGSRDEGAWLLEGNLGIEPVALAIPRVLPPVMTDIEVIDINTAPGFALQPPDRRAELLATEWAIPLDIRLHTLDTIELAGRGLNSEWRGRMHLVGTTAAPRLSGQATLQRGTLFLLGRRFEIDQAIIRFSEATAADPVLFVKARTQAAGLTIELEISGPISRPQFTLRSTPDLPENEVLSHLLFGRATDQISPLQAVTLGYNINLLTGDQNVLWVIERGQTVLGVDQMELVLDDEDSGLAAVTLGKYLGPRLYLEGQKSLGDHDDEVALEYFLTPSISIRTSASPGIREGIGIRWQREY